MDDEDDTPRHTRLRGIDISGRRRRGAATEQVRRGPIADQPDIHGSEGATDFEDREPDSDSFQDYLDVAARVVRQSAVAHDREVEESDEQSTPGRQPTQRVGGRFASTGTSKRPKASEDESWVVTALVDGGPVDGSVIPSFLGHVASRMLGGEIWSFLTCYNRSTACRDLCQWFSDVSPELREMIERTSLSHLPHAMFKNLDTPLLTAFVERWQPDTNSFHMPFGEMTIQLHDVWQILRIPIDGPMVSESPPTDGLHAMCMMIFGVSQAELLLPTRRLWGGGGVFVGAVQALLTEGRDDATRATAWMWLMLGSTLFVDKSGDRIRPVHLVEVYSGVSGAAGLS
ncbi:protein MAIN-LIKE 2-like isoform X2 [Euphorbia lathyris]